MAQFRIVNGKPTFEGIAKANLKDMVTSCAEYFDDNLSSFTFSR